MFISKEIIWFNDNLDKVVLDWFAKDEQTFENTPARTAYYLPLAKDNGTVRLREGNSEVKHRVEISREENFTASATGHFENWIKWSFNADWGDKLSNEITSQNPYKRQARANQALLTDCLPLWST